MATGTSKERYNFIRRDAARDVKQTQADYQCR